MAVEGSTDLLERRIRGGPPLADRRAGDGPRGGKAALRGAHSSQESSRCLHDPTTTGCRRRCDVMGAPASHGRRAAMSTWSTVAVPSVRTNVLRDALNQQGV